MNNQEERNKTMNKAMHKNPNNRKLKYKSKFNR